MRAIILVILSAFMLTACQSTHDFLKLLEGQAYDKAAVLVSDYCSAADSDLARIERNQGRREMRQRGEYGPPGPFIPIEGIDDKTLYGKGPVVRIWCEGEEVPEAVWSDLRKQ